MSRYLIPAELATCALRAARIHSLERGLYLAELETEEGVRWLGSDPNTRAVFRNLSSAREALAGVGDIAVTLVHASAYDEMVGLGPPADNTIEVRLSGGGQQ